MSKPIRVLHYGGVTGGGIGAVLMNLYRAIDRDRVQFDFLCPIEPSAEYKNIIDEIQSLGGRYFSVPPLRRQPFKARRQMSEIIQKSGCDILHCNMTMLSQLIPAKAAMTLGIPVIMHSHATARSFQKGLLRSVISFDVSSFADNITLYTHRYYRNRIHRYPFIYFACSKEAGEEMFGKEAVASGKVYLLNNAINSSEFSYNKDVSDQVKATLSLTDKFVVGSVARFDYPKNHDFIVEVFATVKRQCSHAVLLLVGSGSREDEIKTLVKKEGLSDSVVFTGMRSDIPDILQAIDVFLLPSHYEGLPVAAIEAQAAGLPIIASDAVSPDAKITDLYKTLSLTQSAEEWASVVLEHENTVRLNTHKEIVKAGYDIKDTASMMADYYCDLAKQKAD